MFLAFRKGDAVPVTEGEEGNFGWVGGEPAGGGPAALAR